eukprot:TRINITY_DN3881_c0_g1_i1.p1 TRINITY_DN3881_c0_g1~~TRINITY_DN3881_c0_g1_i1.p1  ORF type:complete len:444 (-),score=93.77 TRINITY_DN3881_c0_g1_i1:1518-2849(-)
MPFVEVAAASGLGSGDEADLKGTPDGDPVKIYYHTYGKGPSRVVFIMGFAAGMDAWLPQLRDLVGTTVPNEFVEDSTEEDKVPPSPSIIGFLKSAGAIESCSSTPRSPLAGQLHKTHGWRSFQEEEVENGTVAEEGEVENGAALIGSGIEAALEKKGIDLKMGGLTCLTLDNRGVGRSSCPENSKHYTSKVLATDILAVMDHLKWEKAHIVGHSMGGMIAAKLAALAPHRVLSLALLSTSCGGFNAIPRVNRRLLSLAYRFATAGTPEKRAQCDLDAHYSKAHLKEVHDDGRVRRDVLFEEYCNNLKDAGLQPPYGVGGHLNVCWHHNLSKSDASAICGGNFLVSVMHGNEDVIANIRAGEKVARRLHPVARMVPLEGGHMINMEKPMEVNDSLVELFDAAHRGVEVEAWAKLGPLQKQKKVRGSKRRQVARALLCTKPTVMA